MSDRTLLDTWRSAWAARARVCAAALLLTSGCLALVDFATSQEQPFPSPPLEASGLEWLAGAVQRSLGSKSLSDIDLAGDALAIRALSTREALSAQRLDALRDPLFALQHHDGSFGQAKASMPLTWLMLGALECSPRAQDAERVRRARVWLSQPDSGLAIASPAAANGSDSVRRAQSFLQTTRASVQAASDAMPSALCSLAGGPFDFRAAYATAMDSSVESRSIAALTPAHELISESLYGLAFTVALFDHYRSTREAALLAEIAHPRATITAELDARFDAKSGAWSAEAGAVPSVVSTACALLIQESLQRWERSQIAQEERGIPADIRSVASRGSGRCVPTF